MKIKNTHARNKIVTSQTLLSFTFALLTARLVLHVLPASNMIRHLSHFSRQKNVNLHFTSTNIDSRKYPLPPSEMFDLHMEQKSLE